MGKRSRTKRNSKQRKKKRGEAKKSESKDEYVLEPKEIEMMKRFDRSSGLLEERYKASDYPALSNMVFGSASTFWRKYTTPGSRSLNVGLCIKDMSKMCGKSWKPNRGSTEKQIKFDMLQVKYIEDIALKQTKMKSVDDFFEKQLKEQSKTGMYYMIEKHF